MNYLNHILKTFLSFTIVLFLTKCYFNPSGGSIEYFQKELKIKNPTIYIFNNPIYDVKKVIKKKFSYSNLGLQLSQKNDYTLYKYLFKDSSNLNDFIIEGFKTNSKIYFTKQDSIPLTYYADFQLHLIILDTCRTLVQVITYDNSIVIGEKTMGFVGEIGTAIVHSVEPTSIEEYEILLKIGETLGVKENMPPLKLPE